MAPVICQKARILYFAVPKNGSSTLRRLFFEIENGFDFRDFTINGQSVDLFWLYRHAQPFTRTTVPEGYSKIAVVRDPLSRFLSNYKWLVVDRNGDFGEMPDIDDFIARFETFVERSPKARFHLTPQSVFLGNDLSYFDKVFRMEALSELADYLSARSGTERRLPWENRTAEQENVLSGSSIEKLMKIYRVDYDFLKEFYGATARDKIP